MKGKTMHGQSEYTESKQRQLKELLDSCRFAWNNVTWAHPTRLFLDCMAGSGHTEDGEPGSPIIMQNFAQTMPNAMCVWSDVNRKFTARLAQYAEPPTQVLTGRYQDVMHEWLDNYARIHRNSKLMGIVYLDDNGCSQVWNDDGFIDWVMDRYPYFDVVIHFSETAWRRSNGADFDWATRNSVLEMLNKFLVKKPESVVYAPTNKQLWRLVYGVRSSKMNLTGSERIKLRDYIRQIETEQQPLFS